MRESGRSLDYGCTLTLALLRNLLDRILVARAQIEGLWLVTTDAEVWCSPGFVDFYGLRASSPSTKHHAPGRRHIPKARHKAEN